MKITADVIKVILQHKYRFQDTYLVASEVDVIGSLGAIADLMVYNIKEETVFEIEIKISKSDLLNDLKKAKHTIYKDLSLPHPCINRFYYAVPTKLLEVALTMIKENELPYGLIEIKSDVIEDNKWSISCLAKTYTYSKIMKIVKRGSKLSDSKITERQKRNFELRLASEAVNNARRVLELKENIWIK